jgi:hypothetical protein
MLLGQPFDNRWHSNEWRVYCIKMDLRKRGWEGVDYINLRVQVFWNVTPCHLVIVPNVS